MKKQSTKDSYNIRIQRVIDYIYDHLDEDLNFEAIAEVACFSPYHWHRIYRSIKGETIHTTVRRMRLQRAAVTLISTKLSIEHIAHQAGYQNTDSFIRSFGKNFGLPPNKYRKEDRLTQLKLNQLGQEKLDMYDVEIKNISDISLATVAHKGDYMEIEQVFDKLIASGMTKGLVDEKTRYFGIYYDDPETVDEKNLRSKAGFTISSKFDGIDNIEPTTVEGGKYAVIRYQGPYNKMMSAYHWLYGVWLPESSEEPRNAPAVEEYLNDAHEVQSSELLTDIYLPLK